MPITSNEEAFSLMEAHNYCCYASFAGWVATHEPIRGYVDIFTPTRASIACHAALFQRIRFENRISHPIDNICDQLEANLIVMDLLIGVMLVALFRQLRARKGGQITCIVYLVSRDLKKCRTEGRGSNLGRGSSYHVAVKDRSRVT
jgi:hypothetical protein